MIQNVIITQADEKYAPPEQEVLSVGLVGDVAFLSIGKYDEEFDKYSFASDDKAVSVPVTDLVNALKSLALSQHRHDLDGAAAASGGQLRPVTL